MRIIFKNKTNHEAKRNRMGGRFQCSFHPPTNPVILYYNTHACAYMHALRTCAQVEEEEEEIEVEKESERKKIFLLQMLTHLCHLHRQTTRRQPTGPVRKKH